MTITSKTNVKIKTALISVSDKTGLLEFAQTLKELSIRILSTGGTAIFLSDNNIPVMEISDYTGFPEMMAGRVKTLHPKIHGGILGRRGSDNNVMNEYGIDAIDMVIVNLYPFEETIARPDCDLDLAVENIDIGGPAMVRSAAKNYQSVCVVVNPDDYTEVVENMQKNDGSVDLEYRYSQAVKAFEHTSAYDGAIANYMGKINVDSSKKAIFPQTVNLQFKKLQSMRYGENPHQNAAFYIDESSQEKVLQLQHKFRVRNYPIIILQIQMQHWNVLNSFKIIMPVSL